LVGNKFRYINHLPTEHANCIPKTLLCNTEHRIGLFASKPIKCGEEIFFDYGFVVITFRTVQLLTWMNRKDFTQKIKLVELSSNRRASHKKKETFQNRGKNLRLSTSKPRKATTDMIQETDSPEPTDVEEDDKGVGEEGIGSSEDSQMTMTGTRKRRRSEASAEHGFSQSSSDSSFESEQDPNT
jgi:hypothetical protein